MNELDLPIHQMRSIDGKPIYFDTDPSWIMVPDVRAFSRTHINEVVMRSSVHVTANALYTYSATCSEDSSFAPDVLEVNRVSKASLMVTALRLYLWQLNLRDDAEGDEGLDDDDEDNFGNLKVVIR